jgi:ribosomal protein S18 acetylase RimI-like enzyme
MALTDKELRDAASHRGLKLVKSRRRKAGSGDYGKFGLTDAAGAPLFGVGDEGLTASAGEIADYLRRGEASTWAESARVTPKAAASKRSAKASDPQEPPSAIRPRPQGNRTSPPSRRRIAGATEPAKAANARPQSDRGSRSISKPSRVQTQGSPHKAALEIRPARRADADVLADLLTIVGFEGGVPAVRKAVSAAVGRKEPMLVADRAGVVGLLAWTVVRDIVDGAIGRISVIVVNEDDRRKGIGKALYEAAVEEFGKRGIRLVEGMSGIEIRNANGFFRALGLQQASYRFASGI